MTSVQKAVHRREVVRLAALFRTSLQVAATPRTSQGIARAPWGSNRSDAGALFLPPPIWKLDLSSLAGQSSSASSNQPGLPETAPWRIAMNCMALKKANFVTDPSMTPETPDVADTANFLRRFADLMSNGHNARYLQHAAVLLETLTARVTAATDEEQLWRYKYETVTHHADALEVGWRQVLAPEKCSYLFGNPPFGGAKYQSAAQRKQVRRIALLGGSGGTLDYVCA